MKSIYTRSHHQILVDDEDYAEAKKYVWRLKSIRHTKNGVPVIHRYVYAEAIVPGKGRVHLHLARLIMKAPSHSRVSFLSKNRLDYRKANLFVNGKPAFYE